MGAFGLVQAAGDGAAPGGGVLVAVVAVEFGELGIVFGDEGEGVGLVVLFVVDDELCGEAGFEVVWVGGAFGPADAHAVDHVDAGGEAEEVSDFLGVVAHAADHDGAEAEGFGGGLDGHADEGGVDGGDEA